MKKELYMPFFYDWLETLEMLEDKEFKKLVVQMVKFHKNPTEMPKFRGSTKMIAGFIFPQLKRLITCRENGKKGGNPKLKNEKNRLNPNSTLGSNTNTNTKSNTNTNTNTDTNPNPNINPNTDTDKFEIFWEKYPKKQRRTNAFEEFIKLNLISEESILHKVNNIGFTNNTFLSNA